VIGRRCKAGNRFSRPVLISREAWPYFFSRDAKQKRVPTEKGPREKLAGCLNRLRVFEDLTSVEGRWALGDLRGGSRCSNLPPDDSGTFRWQ
jgi:hypothetical protein